MNKLKKLLLYGGLDKETYNKVSYRASEENRIAVNIFTVVGATALAVSGFIGMKQNLSIPTSKYFGFAGLFVVMLILNILIYPRHRKISDVFAVMYSIALLSAGVLIAYSQPTERTTMLLPLFSLAALVFCYRPAYLVAVIVGIELAYLTSMKNVQTESLFLVNKVNTIIFSSIGLVSGLYSLNIKYKRFRSEYENMILIEKDGLTGLYNRHSYNNACERIKKIKQPVAICSFDINGLKQINDTKGHAAGDELIRATASCIFDVFGSYGEIFRTGGDEFCAIIYNEFDEDILRREFEEKTNSWKSKLVESVSVALGIARLDHDYENRLLEVISEADAKMYSDKKKHYGIAEKAE